jgi:hypothetical protein
MKHLDFVNELGKLGIRISSTNQQGKIREFKIEGLFKDKTVIAKDFQLKMKEVGVIEESPLKLLLKYAIDMDEWKHSYHIDLIPENYEKIEGIIQEKIIKRANEIDELSSIYFQLHYEMSK